MQIIEPKQIFMPTRKGKIVIICAPKRFDWCRNLFLENLAYDLGLAISPSDLWKITMVREYECGEFIVGLS